MAGFSLAIAEGEGRGRRLSFDAGVTIGRAPGNGLVLGDPGVSRVHARIRGQGGRWVLLDNGSANGTELNGAAIAQPEVLRPGDRIGIGPVVYEFCAELAAGTPDLTVARGRPACDAGSSLARTIAPVEGAARRTPARPLARISPRARAALAALALAVAGAVVALAPRAGEPAGLACPESIAIGDDTLALSFGHGEVDVECGGEAVFGFHVPPGAGALFHYRPGRIGAEDELVLRLNGQPISPAPARSGEDQAVQLPAEGLAQDGRNFVAVAPRVQGRRWSIGEVRAGPLAVPAGNPRAARRAYERGRRKLEERRVAPRNLFDAWAAFVDARQELEGAEPRPALDAELARLVEDCEKDLAGECRKLVFTAERFENYGHAARAQQAWRDVLRHFPGEDPSACRKKAQARVVSARDVEEEE